MNEAPFHIVITGPESSGKTSIWNWLKESNDGHFIPEIARQYLEENGLDYKRQDLKKIAFQQFQKQLEGLNSKSSMIISDTCLLTITIWEEEKYGSIDNFIQEWLHLQKVDYYILMYPDIPWVDDPQRESEGDRKRLFTIYEEKIKNLSVPYSVIKGGEMNRKEEVIRILKSFDS